jgi:hypothetical protein
MDLWSPPERSESSAGKDNVDVAVGATTPTSATSESANAAFGEGATFPSLGTSDDAVNSTPTRPISDVVRQAVSAALDAFDSRDATSVADSLKIEMERSQLPCHLWSSVIAAVDAVVNHVKLGELHSTTVGKRGTDLRSATTDDALVALPELIPVGDVEKDGLWDVDDISIVDGPASPMGNASVVRHRRFRQRPWCRTCLRLRQPHLQCTGALC